MTIPPRWSELSEEPFNKVASEQCLTCLDPKHDVCPMMDGCGCCNNSRVLIFDEGNHNRFAANDTANDELYMAEDIGPIAGGIGASIDEPEGALKTSSWYIEADVLPDATGAPDNSGGAGMGSTPMPMDTTQIDPEQSSYMNSMSPNVQSMMQTASKETVACEICGDDIPHENRYDERPDMYICKDCNSDDHHNFEDRYASTWRSEDYMATIQKQASDSDVYYQGYDDATSGKQMDEGLANLSMDYYQGYKQGLLYNQTNLESAPPHPGDVHELSDFEMPKSAPYYIKGNFITPNGDALPK